MAQKRSRRRRNNSSRVWVIGGIFLVAVLAVALVALNSNASNAASGQFATPAPAAPLDKCGSEACGAVNAPVTLDVYADFQCPYCKAFDPVLQQLAANYVDTGKVKIVYHNFTLIGPESETAAQAALCAADQKRFWQYANNLFAHQGAENSGVFTPANLKALASSIGLDTGSFGSCLDSGKHASQVSQERAEGVARGVKATPTFFVNGQMHEGGATYQDLTTMIDAALAR